MRISKFLPFIVCKEAIFCAYFSCSIGVTCYLAVEKTLGNDSIGQFKDREPSGALSSYLENGLTSEEKENDQNTLNTCVRVTGNMASVVLRLLCFFYLLRYVILC